MNSNQIQSNHHFGFTIAVDATKEKVWETLIDVENWHKWDTEILSAKLVKDFSLGSTGKMVPKKGPKLDFYISEITPHKTYTFKTKMPLGWLEIKRTISEENNNVLFNDDIQFTGILKRFFGLLLGGGFKKVLPEVMENFKKIAEKK
jgi:Polyketide cyclase / dehydrase and lipid transport